MMKFFPTIFFAIVLGVCLVQIFAATPYLSFSLNKCPRPYDTEILFFGMNESSIQAGENLRMSFITTQLQTLPLSNVVFHIRAVGPSIVAGSMPASVATNINGVSAWNYSSSLWIRDPGEYKLQVRVSWLTGADLGSRLAFRSLNTTRFLDESHFADCVVFNESLSVRPNAPNRRLDGSNTGKTLLSVSKPLCNFTSNLDGRWVYINPGEDCPRDVCVGSAKDILWLNDKFAFNRDYVYSPWHCNLVLYNIDTVASCFKKQNASHIAFTGDSLLREHFQNLRAMFNDHDARVKKIKSTHIEQFTLPNQYVVTISYAGGFRDRSTIVLPLDHHLWSTSFHKTIANGNKGAFVNDVLGGFKKHHNLEFFKSARVSNTFYFHPMVQREDPRVNRSGLLLDLSANITKPGTNGFAQITPLHQAAANSHIEHELKSKVQDEKFSFLDGRIPTKSRWESSWDGVHYSMLVSQGDLSMTKDCATHLYLEGAHHYMCDQVNQFPAINKCSNTSMFWRQKCASESYDIFEGGVSRMLTLVWLNKICN